MRAAIGSQCKLIKRGVTWALFGSLNSTLDNSGSIAEVRQYMLEDLPREHYNSLVWIEQELGREVVWNALIERV